MNVLNRIQAGVSARMGLAAWHYLQKNHPAAPAIVHRLPGGPTWPVDEAENLTANALAYRVSTWVYACVYAIQEAGSTLPLRLYQRKGQDREDWLEINEHPLLDLLDRPNENEWDTWQAISSGLFADLELHGNWYLYMNLDDAGLPTELFRMRPDRMKVVPDPQIWVRGYVYDINGQKIPFERQEVIHHKTYNPYDDFYGLSSISPARLAVVGYTQAELYNDAFWKNSAVPAGALRTDQELSTEVYKRLKEDWRKTHKGTDKAHRTAILEQGLEWQGIGVSYHDADFIPLQKMTREQIAAAFQVPPALIGIFEYANYANAERQELMFWHGTMIPKIQKQDQALTRGLARRFGDDLVLMTDLTGVQALIAEQRDAMKVDTAAIDKGLRNVNDTRKLRKMGKPYPWGDDYLVPMNLVPWSQTWGAGKPPGSEEPPEAPPVAEEAAPGLPPRFRRLYPLKLVRDARWGYWQALIAGPSHQFARMLRGKYDQQRASVVAAYEASLEAKVGTFEIESWLFDFDDWDDIMRQAARPTLLNAANEGGMFILGELKLEMEFNLTDPRLQQAIDSKAFVFAHQVNGTTLDQLRATLSEGIQAGELKEEVIARIDHVFKGRKNNADVVAQTEVSAMSNKGAVEAMRQTGGIVVGKEWHAGGPRPRAHHAAANGQVVGVNDPFYVGGEHLEYPGDPAGSARNVCNCHCAMLPVVKE